MVTRRDLLVGSGTALTGSGLISEKGDWGWDHARNRGKGRGPDENKNKNEASRPTKFVERRGDQFMLNGRSFYFSGTNNFWLRDPYRTRDEIDRLLETLEEAGVNTIRTWGFCSGEGGNCLQPAPGEYDEAAFDLLDYVVAEAGDRGMRLILPLANNWGDYGGMAQYVEWSSTAEGHDDFYTDDEAQALYRDFVEYVLTRENGYTGVEYREDPAIMMWELANEPRAQEAADGLERMTQWVEESAAFIKDIDDNHLLSTGMEGFYNHVGNWAFDGFTGTDYVEHHKIDGIDACSFHLYPESWGLSLEEGTQWIRSHIHTAREEVGKPAYLGEFGVEAPDGDSDKMAVRNETYTEWYDLMHTMDADGVAVWQLSHPDFVSDDHHIVPEDEETLDILAAYRERAEAKSGMPIYADARRRKHRQRRYTDDTPPTTPSNLEVTAVQSHWADLEWDAATDRGESGLKHYAIFVDGEEHALVGPNRTATRLYGLERETEYELAVSATDWSDNESARSDPATVRTSPSHRSLVDYCEDLELLHGDSDTDNIGVTSSDAEFFPRPGGETDDSRFERVEGTETDLIYEVDGAVSGLAFEYHRHADADADGSVTVAESTDGGETWTELEVSKLVYDEAGETGWINAVSTVEEFSAGVSRVRLTLSGSENWAQQIGYVGVRYQTTETDTAPPNAPWGLEATGSSYTTVDLSWEPATEPGPSGLDHYVILVDGEPTQTVAGEATTATVAGLDPGTDYEFSVAAVDGVGQESEPSESTVATTADSGTLSDPCADLSSLHEDSDTTVLKPEGYEEQGTVHPDGSLDEDRIARASGDDAAVIYDPGGPIVGFRAEIHIEAYNPGAVAFQISSDDGDTWTEIEPTVDVYNDETELENEDGDWWINAEYTYADFPMGTDLIRIDLSGSESWNPQVGHVDVHFDDTIPAAPDAIATAVTDSTADLEWDDVAGVSEYDVYVDETFDHTVETTATTVDELEAGTNYDVTVRSVNSAGNESDDSGVVPIFTTSGATEMLEDTCADTDSLAPESDTDNLAVTGFDPKSFIRPDGSEDDTRFERPEGDVDTAAVYEVSGAPHALRVEGHMQPEGWGGGHMTFAVSTDGGDTWEPISPAADVYDDFEGEGSGYNNTEFRYASFAEGVTHVRIELVGPNGWTPELGHVELTHTP